MRNRFARYATVAPAALMVVLNGPLNAGTFEDIALQEVFGDGYVYVDTEEGVVEPGVQAVTGDVNADYPNTSSPSGIENCLMASNPDVTCTSERGSGKRIKTRLTGQGGMDMLFSTRASSGITEYFLYGKTSNLSGARITGMDIQLGTGSGEDFVLMDPSDPAVAALFDTDYISKFNLPDGLFGNGGNEGAGTGFFDDTKATMTSTLTNPTLALTDLTNAVHSMYFGDALLDNSMVPDGYFWDATGTPLESDEGVLIAWYNTGEGKWLYGTLGTDTPDPGVLSQDERVAELAKSLGVTVAQLGYTSGGEIPADILAKMEADSIFSVDVIEDLRNLNLNFIIDLGDVDGNQVTLRLVPTFEPIVQQAQTPYQFSVAGHLDGAANVPYLDLGNAAIYSAAIDSLLAMDAVQRADQLERIGFSFMPAFSSLGFEFSRSQVGAFNNASGPASGADESVSTRGDASKWQMGSDLNAIMSISGTRTQYDNSLNSVGYDLDFANVSVGVEKTVNNDSSVGLMLGWSKGTADAFFDRGSVEATGVSLAAFGRTTFGKSGNLQGIIGYQGLSYDSTRNVMGQTATGSTDGSQIFAAVRGDYMVQKGALSFGPTMALEYYGLNVDAYDETGAGPWNLTVGDQSSDVFLASVGVRGAYDLPSNRGNTKLTGSIAFTKSSGRDYVVENGFVGLNGNPIPVDGFDEGWVDVSVGISTELSRSNGSQTVLHGGYSGSFSDTYESHGLSAGLQMVF